MTQVNLLPPELRQRQRTRRQTVLVAMAGVVAVAAVLALWFLQGLRIAELDDQIEAQQAENAQLQQRVNNLQRFAELRSELESRRLVVETVLAGGVEWSGVLRDVSLVMPDQMWLTSLSASATSSTQTGTPPAPGATTDVIGSIAFQGASLDTDTLALWLTRLESVPGWINPWLTSAQQNLIGETNVYIFNTSVDLAPRAARGGQR